uniref:hypothetical protein n=1 Tax=Rhodospirillum sp. A1_3_36 TaxID=3391666 RepID=UPI0039A6DDE9
YWEKAVEAARKRGFSPEIERTEIHLQVAKEFVAAKKPLPHSSARIAEIGDRRWNALEADRKAAEKAQQENARKAEAERRRAQEAEKTALADRYEARWRIAEKAAKAAQGAEWQKSQLEQAHPWRARLHKIGLKFGPLSEVEGRIKAAQKAGEVLLADTEGRNAWKERRAVLEAKKQAEARKIEAERQAALQKEAQKRRAAKPKNEQAKTKAPKKGQGPGFGMGF